ncbi:adenylate/guanylate cyclase domain-containing protein [Actinocorallia aurantiaca]|uniref:Adenylate/guanylate cyclase domain-containing protein n=1 Tax=Actinocorallia aurantiaca TaxID=46204 RepID=A0ABP6GSC1_9ACTN
MAETRAVEELLLGEPLLFTLHDVKEKSGIDLELALRIWSALGFPTPPGDVLAFTEEDVVAMRTIRELLEHEYVDEEMVLQLSRGVGQTMSRLAHWLGEVWLERLAEHLVRPGEAVTDETVAAALLASAELRPKFENLLLRGWRRQLAAVGVSALTATATATADPGAGTAVLAVGFADIVSFTRLSRNLDADGLAELVDRFETETASIIATLGGRVIKTLGDEVLFTAPDAASGAEISLRISERSTEEDFPRVRVGVAYGEVILRLGDVFGTPVNTAARLTAEAYPGTVLASPAMGAELAEGPYRLKRLKARSLQGLGKVRPCLLRREASR